MIYKTQDFYQHMKDIINVMELIEVFNMCKNGEISKESFCSEFINNKKNLRKVIQSNNDLCDLNTSLINSCSEMYELYESYSCNNEVEE